MDLAVLKKSLENVRSSAPLIHAITNYVTVNDCANALLACGGSPIMSDEPKDVADITALCGGLVLNIGTLHERSIEAMRVAGRRAADLNHVIVLDPVGAGASRLRTETAAMLLDELPISAVRGNMSEIKALAGASGSTRGVDVNPADAVTDDNLLASVSYVAEVARKTGAVMAVTGAIDVVTDGKRAFAVRNGVPLMGKMTGAGCMLTCIVAAYAAANGDDVLSAVVAAVANEGLCGQIAAGRMTSQDGNGMFRTYLLDALCTVSGSDLEQGALVEEVSIVR